VQQTLGKAGDPCSEAHRFLSFSALSTFLLLYLHGDSIPNDRGLASIFSILNYIRYFDFSKYIVFTRYLDIV
jgi:hypothetical protein